ncbi:hypothetical protein BGZ49_006270, partial [Haplosporangium sp. Z 27]
KHQRLRETGSQLFKKWANTVRSSEVTGFWSAMRHEEAKKKHLETLHVEVYSRETAVARSHTREILRDLGKDSETSSNASDEVLLVNEP